MYSFAVHLTTVVLTPVYFDIFYLVGYRLSNCIKKRKPSPLFLTTALHLDYEYLTAVNLTQIKMTAFNLTATDTDLQAKRTFNFFL